jgi:hypothetical protein
MTEHEKQILKSLPNFKKVEVKDDETFIYLVNITGDLVKISGVLRVETDGRRDDKNKLK